MSIDDVLGMARDVIGLDDNEYDHLRALLLSREDNIADHLRLAARQFNVKAEIVAEVLVQAGLGTPPSKEQRDLIRQNYLNLMDKTQRGWRDSQ